MTIRSRGSALSASSLLSVLLLSPHARAAYVDFQNCLPESIRHPSSTPPLLQFTPYFVDAGFDLTNTSHALSLSIYGNVSGQQYQGTYPPPGDPHWTDNGTSPEAELGKITLIGNADKYTTLTALYQVVTYTAYDNHGEIFCDTVAGNYSCPLGPSFYANASNPADLPYFTLSQPFNSTYAFSTISTTVRVLSGDINSTPIACVNVQITPSLGRSLSDLLTWLPAGILILKGIATLSAAIFSPWGSSDIFRWSSNYGRDEDLLRLVTPGFGDCLQYIQFAVLTGSLTLNYPGFFQPALSHASWSVLMFNESFVTGGPSRPALTDGIYTANATYGLTQMSELIGMRSGEDIWACMAVWLLVIAVIVVVATQLGFFSRWAHRTLTHTSEEDLRRKNLPFTFGNLSRLLFNYFILPIVSLSLFQLVISPRSAISVVVCAAILLVIMILTACWILRVIFVTKPRTILFDDMPTVLLYGPLYNTYNDSAAPFALIPVFITFMRGVAIGAVQPSGIAQIIILAICEVILLLTLNGFRPFQGQTSMNIYHTIFSSVRIVIVLLMIAFVPSLQVASGPAGWIGYIILILHAFVLVCGFFLNSAQTIIEVIARACGAGDAQSGAVRGSILGWRMLKKRRNRPDQADRASMASHAAILRQTSSAARSNTYGGRSRSISASSHNLLNRVSVQDAMSFGDRRTSNEPDEPFPGLTTVATFNGSLKTDDSYYRPPRARKATLDAFTVPGGRTRSGVDFPYQDTPRGHMKDNSYDSAQSHDSPAPAYLRERVESGDHSGPRPDYAVREVDQYYQVPAPPAPLSELPTRKLRTGPADPEGPASAAQGWFQRLMMGRQTKKKEPVKGFEVVRAARSPPPDDAMEMQPAAAVPYLDSPPLDAEEQAIAGASHLGSPQSRSRNTLNPNGFDLDLATANSSTARNIGGRPIRGEASSAAARSDNDRRMSHASSNYDRASSHVADDQSDRNFRVSDAPSLAPLDFAQGVNRYNSTASQAQLQRRPTTEVAADWLAAVDALHTDRAHHNLTQQRPGPSQPSRTADMNDVFSNFDTNSPPDHDSHLLESPPEFGASHAGLEHLTPGLARSSGMDFNTGHSRGESYTNVSHHRAGDSITRNSFGASLQGERAEYFSAAPAGHAANVSGEQTPGATEENLLLTPSPPAEISGRGGAYQVATSHQLRGREDPDGGGFI